MKEIKITAIVIGFILIMYLFCAFAEGTFNILLWPKSDRIFIAFTTLCIAGCLAGASNSNIK